MKDGNDLQQLKNLLIEFRDKREWAQFHDLKNLAQAISIESGELQELFLWKDKKSIEERAITDPAFRERIGEELADIFIFALYFAITGKFDISSIVEDKMNKSESKYSVDKARGNATKYTEL
jgi:NTP pyrophosphatase (non-canonical NTP hydrolase)